MTKAEIMALIASKIEGQGNQVDTGSALPSIIKGVVELADKSYLSVERLRKYLYRITFDSLPDDSGNYGIPVGGCSAYVADGKLYRNLDFYYDNTASFIIRCREFEGMAFITGLNDGELADDMLRQLPYRVVDGRNNSGIMVSTHILYNDWGWTGTGAKNVPLMKLPHLVLARVKSMATIAQDLAGVVDNLASGPEMGEYIIQVLVTDGQTTYALLPPVEDGAPYVIQDISANPKLTNFRWVSSPVVERGNLQRRPTGVERFNAMPCPLSDLRFTKAYESPVWLSEFIGLRETTKDSSDAELMSIYNVAHDMYLRRERDGQTWQTVHSVIYGNAMLSLFVQEDWTDDICRGENRIGDLSALDTDHKATIVDAINELADALETEELVVSAMQSNAERKLIYDLCARHLQLAKNIVFWQPIDQMYYSVNGYNMVNGGLKLHVVLGATQTTVTIAPNGSLMVE